MNLLNTLLIFCFTLCFGAASLNAQNVNIPDANFKAYLVGNAAINTNSDGEIQVTEASAFSGTINCPSLGIADLTGVEAFVNLTSLNCRFNNIASLDVTQNTNLTFLDCRSNDLINLDVAQNTSLITLNCGANDLVTLNVNQNISLTSLYSEYNELTSLDVTQNTNLVTLSCYNNQLTGLDVTQNTSLVSLQCQDNELTSLSISTNINLNSLRCQNNELTSLDVNQNVNLTSLNCYTNKLTSLDVTQNMILGALRCHNNELTSLNVKNGNNNNFTNFDATNNPNLTCIEVDDSTYSTNNWTNVDPAATFSTNCSVFNNINSINQEINLTAYPNPTRKDITLDFGKLYQETKIEVTNLTGQIVLNKIVQNNSTANLELEGAAGVYFVNIQTEEGMATLKIIKE